VVIGSKRSGFCALTLGLRKGELLGLRWKDIDFGNEPSLSARVITENETPRGG
jgi:hypothetical protein